MTLEELVVESSERLDQMGIEAASGRVRERPDGRTIRYYTTIGLVDPPLDHRGRVARYGPRHVLQVVAVKVLQAQGRGLAELQQLLLGATDAELRRFIGEPGVASAAALAGAPPAPPAPRRPLDFWRQAPAPQPSPAPTAPIPVGVSIVGDPPPLRRQVAVDLAPGVSLVVEVGHDSEAELDLPELRAAAAPLLTLLARRRHSISGEAR